MKTFFFVVVGLVCFIRAEDFCDFECILKRNFSNTTNSTQTREVLVNSSLSVIEEHVFKTGATENIPIFAEVFKVLLPPLNFIVPDISTKCKKQGQIFLEELSRFSLWALQMYDSSAKIPSGLLNGNINQLGDFDQCMRVHSGSDLNNNEDEIIGKYCLTNLQIDPPSSPRLAELYKLFYSHFPFKSNITDPAHIAPRFSSLSWGLCVPSGCTETDVENILKSIVVETAQKHWGVNVHVQVEPDTCTTLKEQTWPSTSYYVALGFLSYIIFVVAISLYDYIYSNSDSLLMSFSLIRNSKSLFSTSRSNDDIHCVHGIRFLNALMLLLAHKSLAFYYMPFINRTEMAEITGQPWTVLARALSLYTDPFIMLSGMLTAYSFFEKLNRNQSINIKNEYVSRLIRIVPSLAALISFCTFVLPYLNSGPHWGIAVLRQANTCKSTWWRNFLFISNYLGYSDICLTHTHHIGIDMQLFIVSPLLIYVVWKWPRKGITALVAVASIMTVMRYYVTYTRNLSNYIFFGTSVTQLIQTADYMYTLPIHRSTVYIMGILLGYVLRTYKVIYMKPVHLAIGHAFALLMFCAAFLGPAPMGSMHYTYNPVDAAWYAAFAPIAWCYAFGWIIFTSYYGYQSFLTKILSHRYFLITTRLSYAIYLTQYPIYFYNVGTLRTAESYGFIPVMVNIKEYAALFILSAILTLLFDTPFQNIKNKIFKKKPQKNTTAQYYISQPIKVD